jgi:hypothetical protein
MGVKMIQQNPFMLSLSKHVSLFFNNLPSPCEITREAIFETVECVTPLNFR